jgi:tetratricopeptide (TPR) repeat protein
MVHATGPHGKFDHSTIQPMTKSGVNQGLLIAVGLLLLTAAIAWGNSFSGPFVLDDVLGILENPTLRQLWPLTGPLAPIPGGLTVSGRPVLNLSFAINHAISGTDVWSYHALNLLIHLLAALALFGVVRRTLARLSFSAALPLAALAASLWLAHPLQTESVTYVVQRAESLMGLLYLGTLYAVIRGADSRRPWTWYAAAVLACVLGMGTKEVMASAPIVVLLYDRAFLAGSFLEAWRKRKGLYVLLASTWMLLLWLLALTGNRDGSYGLGIGVSWQSHATMQFAAVAHYLWLAVWPHPLIFDYGLIRPHGIGDVLPYALIVLLLLAATVRGLIRNTPWGFLGAWFFLILAPTSSILPSGRQTFSEHRMYLPLAALSVAAVLALYSLLQRRTRITMLVGALCVAILCLLTANRNRDYRSDLALYASVVTTYPGNAYGHFVYASGLLERGQDDEALKQLDIAARLQPDDKAIRINHAYVLLRLNRAAEALAEYEAGFKLGPVSPDTFLGYAAALVSVGRTDEGMGYFSEYTRRRPQDVSAYFTVGQLLLAAGKSTEAIDYLERAQAMAPDSAEIGAALGKARQRL